MLLGLVSSYRQPRCPGRCSQLSSFAIARKTFIVVAIDDFCSAAGMSVASVGTGWGGCRGGEGVIVLR